MTNTFATPWTVAHQGSSVQGIFQARILEWVAVAYSRGSRVAQWQNLPANAGDVGSVPGLGRSPGEGNATYSGSLAWKIPWTEEPGGLQSMGSQKTRTQLSNYTTTTNDAKLTRR